MKNKLKNNTLIIVCMILLTAFQSCFSHAKEIPQIPKEQINAFIGYTKAIVINTTLDGCSWMLELEDGKKLEPVNLMEKFKKDNTKVWIQYKHYDNYSFCMSGEMVTVIAIDNR